MSKTLDLLRDGKGQPEERIKYFGIDPTPDAAARVLAKLISFEPDFLNSKKATEVKHPAISGFDMALMAVARLRKPDITSKHDDDGLIPFFNDEGVFVKMVHRPFSLGLPSADTSERIDQEKEELSRKAGFLYGLSVLSRDEVFEGEVERVVPPIDLLDLKPSDTALAVLQSGSRLLIAQTFNADNNQAFEMGYYGTFPSNYSEVSAYTIVDRDSNLGSTALKNSSLLPDRLLVS